MGEKVAKLKNSNRNNLAGILILISTIICLVLGCIFQSIHNEKIRIANMSDEDRRAMTYGEFEEGSDSVENTGNIKFSAFFLRDINGDGYAERIKGTCKEIGKQDTLYMELNVLTKGKLTNGKIEIQSENFYLQTALPKDDQLKDNYISTNLKEIELNDMTNGTQKIIMGIVRSGDYSYSNSITDAIGTDTSKYSKINKIVFTGTYEVEGEEPVEIRKEVDLTVDWYATTKAEIPRYIANIQNLNQTLDNTNVKDEENGEANFEFKLGMWEKNNTLLLKSANMQATIPELNGYAPIKVEVIGNNITYSYNEQTRIVTMKKEATLDENQNVTSNAYDGKYLTNRYNKFNLKITYPLEAYESVGGDTVELKIPVEGYYEGYNNPNSEFNNPYKSNVVNDTFVLTFKKPEGRVARFDVTVGEYMYVPTQRYVVSKKEPLKIYNEIGNNKQDTYIVTWYGYTGTDGESTGMVMKETKNGEIQVSDKFINATSAEYSMEELTSNIGIYFGNAINLLGEEGWIKVYDDETGELIETFTKENWSSYSESNPYEYAYPVKHIRVETSKTNAESSLTVYNVKELDDEYITTNYTREEFDNLKYIKSTLTGYLGNTYINTDTHNANYEAPYSLAELKLSKTAISTQGTEKNMVLTIETQGDEKLNQEKWINGSFLIKLPEEITNIDINSVTSTNSSVKVISYEQYEQDGAIFIKVNTQNEKETTFNININCDITPDPRGVTTTKNLELYAINENGTDYYYKSNDIYDLDGDTNVTEQINKRTASLSLVSPNSMLTNQIIKQYDEDGNVTIAPNCAIVAKERDKATIDIELKNNYSSTISEVVLLGRVPYQGNKYVINGGDLGSEFSVTMANTGIILPDELQEKATIYYSENGEATNDLTDSNNGWTKTPSDFSKVKSYLIDFGDYVFEQGEKKNFTYDVNIPSGIEYNKITYSHHAIYFTLDTENGKYKTKTEPNKVGLMIAKQYDLEVTKYQTGKSKLVEGATYSIVEEGQEEGKTRVTDTNGKITLTGLYIDKTYILKEIKTPNDYELNETEVKFKATETNGQIRVELISGTTKNIEAINPQNGEDYKVKIQVEDEAKATLKITKLEQGTTTTIGKVEYKLTGSGLPETGKTVITNSNGETTIKGLKIGEEYTLEETKAEGYYLNEPVKFKIVNNNGTYTTQIISGTVKNTSVTLNNEIPTINVQIEDEKIPRFELELTKIKHVTNVAEGSTVETTYLPGAKFKLFKDGKELGKYETNSTGKLTIEDLYQYETEKDIDQTYILKEVLPPDGYVAVKDITFKVEKQEGTLKFIEELQDGQAEKQYTVEGNKVKLVVEDSPSFKLIKKDAETGAVLPNIKFAIYNVDEGNTFAKNSKGEYIGEKQTINGREYYIVTTDNNGEITASLPEGMYKAVEVEAPEQYDISKNSYTFGIGVAKEPETIMAVDKAISFGGNSTDKVNSVAKTEDGGFIVVGNFNSGSITTKTTTLTRDSSNGATYEGFIIKYNSEGEEEWAKSVGGSGNDHVNSVAITSDGGVLVGGSFLYNISTETTDLNSNGGLDALIIKYNSKGEEEWAKSFGGNMDDNIETLLTTKDGGYIIGGYFTSSNVITDTTTLVNTSALYYDAFVIKYNAEGEEEWAKSFGGRQSEQIKSIAETNTGEYIAVGYYNSSNIVTETTTLTNKGQYDGIIIKYNSEGEEQWSKTLGNEDSEYLYSVSSMQDGGFILGGLFYSSNLETEKTTLINKGSDDGIIIKYNAEGEEEWAKSIGGSSNDCIYSVIETEDNGYAIGGFYTDTIATETQTIKSIGSNDGLVIKYNKEGNEEWVKSIGGSSADDIKAIIQANDGNIITIGNFSTKNMNVGEEILENKGSEDIFIAKIIEKEIPEVVATGATNIDSDNGAFDYINTIFPTKDGGYIAGGSFNSSITIEEKTYTSNKYSDGIIIKYSKSGQVEWVKTFGGNNEDSVNSITETADGEYIVGGKIDGIVKVDNIELNAYGRWSGFIIKLDTNGNTQWGKVITEGISSEVKSISATKNGEILVGGNIYDGTGRVGDITITSNGSYDGLIIKYDSEGNVIWARNIGGPRTDEINSVIETEDGEIVAGGSTTKGEVDYDCLIIKYDIDGNVEWNNSFGGYSHDVIYSLCHTSDGGFIAGGSFSSSTIQLGNIILQGKGGWDGLIIKYDTNENIEWAKAIGETSNDLIYSVIETSDGGYIVGGEFSATTSIGDIPIINRGSYDSTIIKYNSNGKVEWAKNLGGESQDCIKSIAETTDGQIVVGGYYYGSSIGEGKYNLTNKDATRTNGFVMALNPIYGTPDVQELEITNSRKEFKITTDVNEIDGVKGGSISGEDKMPYEAVKYGENSTKEIKMIPAENYEIISITVNGKEYPFTKEADGSYTMPQFTDMKEDKHIVVTYSLKDNKITINKVDKTTRQKLSGAKFKLDQIEERTTPNQNVIGTLNDNGQEYVETNVNTEVTGKLGTLTNNGDYYFVEQNGKYVPTNGKTYQLANGGSAGISNTTSNSYIPIDLTGLTGKYAIVVNASISSENTYDYGYATITESDTAPTYSTEAGRFMYISGTQEAKDYTSNAIDGGETYYLHLGYRKDGSGDTGDDQVVINSIKLYSATETRVQYNFTNNSGKYESTNQGKDSTTANSYIPIDLTTLTGKYNLVVNAEVSSQSSDYGYATVTENTDRVTYSNSTGRFIYIAGTQEAKDYSTVLQGGKMYYLHIGYYKNASGSEGDDKFAVNSIRISLNDSELYHATVETNSNGQGITQIPFGKYKITETKAPEGYELNTEPTIVEFRSTDGAQHEFTMENEKLGKIIVHHYIKGTTTKLAEDETSTDKVGEKYTTSPKLDLAEYELEVDTSGKYVLPTNANGTYQYEDQEITYYYVKKQIPLIVHHYIEGTSTKVPLANGSAAQDTTDKGNEGENYTTNALTETELNAKYKLVETPENATGTYEYSEVEVTYYYQLRQNKVTTKVKTHEETDELGITTNVKGGTISGEEDNIYETVDYGEDSTKEIKAVPDEGYRVKSITVNGEPIEFTENSDKSVTLSKFIEMTEDKDVVVEFEKIKGTVIVHHYIEGTTTKVPLNDGTEAPDETKTGELGYEYTTRVNENVSDKYQFVSVDGEETGEYIDGTIEVTYYYKHLSAGVVVHHYIVGTENKVPNRTEGTVDDQNLPTSGVATVGDSYTTSNATDRIAYNYRVATNEDVYGDNLPSGKNANDIYEPNNKNGQYEEEKQEVIYYYILKTPKYTHTITKTGTESISKEDDTVSYSIKYSINIEDYIGNGTITIVDTLPYEIDTTKSNINGGTYNRETKTITWTESRTNINPFTNAQSGQIEITKNISVVYKDLDYSKNSMTNTVSGKTELTSSNTTTDTLQDTANTTYKFYTNVTANKVWEDNNDELRIRPSTLEVTLKASVDNGSGMQVEYAIPNSVQKTVTLKGTTGETNGENWRYVWNNLDKYSAEGKLINYTVAENLTGNIANVYKGRLAGENNVYTITNTYTEPTEKINLIVNKTWEDNNDKNRKRPAQIKFVVYKETPTKTKVEEYTLNTSTETSHTFSLLRYDEKGNKINYIVEEERVNENDLKFYQTEVGNIEEKMNNTTRKKYYETTIKNTFNVPDVRINVSVTKIWEDNNNENQKRPNNIRIVLSKQITKQDGTAEISKVEEYILKVSENESTHTFTNLAKYDESGNEIKYIVSEEDVNERDLYFYANEIKETTTNNFTITNTFTVPKDQIEITAEKVWDDNLNRARKRPSSVIIKLLRGTEKIKEGIVNEANNWKVKFDKLAKYDSQGNEIEYTVKEQEAGERGLYFYKEGVLSGNMKEGFKITNTFNVPDDRIEIKATKIWNDNNGKRPENIVLVLTGNGKEYTQQISNENIDPNDEYKWTYTFENLPKYDANGNEIQYSLSEREAEEGTLKKYITTANKYNVTNTLIVKGMSINKTGTEKIASLEDKVEYEIKYATRIDKEYTEDVKVTIVDTLPYEIDTSKKYELDGGTYNSEEKTITWTGTYNFETKRITWEDGKEERLEKEIETTKNISLVYKDIDVTSTVLTNNVTGYIELKNGYKGKKEAKWDTEVDFTKVVKANKVWVGDAIKNENGNISISSSRPESITLELNSVDDKGELTKVAEGTLNMSNNWKIEWTKLPKYDATTREEIEYKVTENNVPEKYYSKIEQKENEFTVTNLKYGTIAIKKVDSKYRMVRLAGAEFKLEKLKEEKGKLVKDEEFETRTAITSSQEPYIGEATFENLEYGKYRLTETKAPEGYKLSKEEIDIEITEENVYYEKEITNEKEGTDENKVLNKEPEQNINQTKRTENTTSQKETTKETTKETQASNEKQTTKETNLPTTGGIGTTIFTIIGGILVIIGVAIYIKNRK